MNLESREAMWVVADQLEECGDPRAELIRAQLDGRPDQHLLDKHWSEWVGTLKRESTLCRWKAGHLVEVSIAEAPPLWSPDDLLNRPAARLMGRLALGPKVSSHGLAQAPALRVLVCMGSIRCD